jgi:rhodanese-related sulfurtransferase
LEETFRSNPMKKLLIAMMIVLSANLAFAQSGRISPADARALLARDASVLLVDVRTEGEFAAGHIKGASLLPYDAIDAASAAALIKDKNRQVLVYCRSGHRSGIAAKTLAQLGYGRVLDLGGIIQWPYGLVPGKE